MRLYYSRFIELDLMHWIIDITYEKSVVALVCAKHHVKWGGYCCFLKAP